MCWYCATEEVVLGVEESDVRKRTERAEVPAQTLAVEPYI
jgi:hypothetical protein